MWPLLTTQTAPPHMGISTSCLDDCSHTPSTLPVLAFSIVSTGSLFPNFPSHYSASCTRAGNFACLIHLCIPCVQNRGWHVTDSFLTVFRLSFMALTIYFQQSLWVCLSRQHGSSASHLTQRKCSVLTMSVVEGPTWHLHSQGPSHILITSWTSSEPLSSSHLVPLFH
jgi:hypothetical protein